MLDIVVVRLVSPLRNLVTVVWWYTAEHTGQEENQRPCIGNRFSEEPRIVAVSAARNQMEVHCWR